MDYHQAREIGDAGEARVAEELERLQARYSFSVLHDVLLVKDTPKGPITAQLDHVVIDQYGAWIIETKTRTNALIRGTYADAKWTACYPGNATESFQNPLRQNDQHINRLHQALKEAGLDLPFDRLRGLVVMVDAVTSQLELDSVSEERVATLPQLAQRFATRHDFAIQQPLSFEEVAGLQRLIARLDRSSDPAAQQAHDQNMRGRRSARTIPPSQGPRVIQPAVRSAVTRSYAQAAVPPEQTKQEQAPGVTTGRIVLLVLALAVLGLVVWAVLGIIDGTAPSWVWVGILILLAALGGGSSAPAKRRARRAASKPTRRASFGEQLLAAVVALALLGTLVVGSMWVIRTWLASLGSGSVGPSTVAVQPPVAPAANIPLAKQRLREADPKLYAKIPSPDSPRVTARTGGITYEWHYLQKTSLNSVSVRKFSITLDAEGQVVGASAR